MLAEVDYYEAMKTVQKGVIWLDKNVMVSNIASNTNSNNAPVEES